MFERNFADLGHVLVHWFDRAVFLISRLVLFLIRRGNPLKMYFELAEKQAFSYAENALCYRCFSRNLAKIYRTAILTNFFRYMRTKSQWSTHPVVFFNLLMLVVTKGHRGSLS